MMSIRSPSMPSWLRGDSAEHVLGHQAVLAGVRARGNGQRDALAVLLDRQVVAVGREHGGDVRHPLGVTHFFSTTGTDVPDHSPKILTTMEMAAFFAPATMTGTCCGADRMRWNSSSRAKVPSGLRGDVLLARQLELAPGVAALLDHPVLHVGLGQAGGGEHLRVLGAEHQRDRGLREDQRPHPVDGVLDVAQHVLVVGGVPVVDELHGAGQRRGDRGDAAGHPAVLGERLPGRLFLVLGDADLPAAGQALGGLLEDVRVDAERVADDEADRARDRGVRPEPRAERAARGVEAEFLPDRAVDHDQG